MTLKSLLKRYRLHQIGYVVGQNGIYNRYLRETEGWNRHLSLTREIIIETVEKLKPKSICFLGSGWLLDVPMEQLLSKQVNITLVDIYHPPQVAKRYAQHSRVKFLTSELTGGFVDFISTTTPRRLNFFQLANYLNRNAAPRFDADLVASLNILSQLSDIPLEYLRRRAKIPETLLLELAGTIQQRHIDSLPSGKSLIITDIQEEYSDDSGKLLAVRPTVYVDLSMLSQVREWNWRFDTTKTYNEEANTSLRVVAGLMF